MADGGDGWSPTERADLFVRRCDELLDEPAARDAGLRVGFTLAFDVGAPVRTELRQPPEPLLKSFLMSFRPFVSKSEPVFISRVHNVVAQNLSDGPLRERFIEAHRAWKRSNRAGALKLNFFEEDLSPAYTLDLWVNGHYFHNDKRKIAELERLAGLPGALTRHSALDLVVETTNHIQYVASVIDFGRSEGLLRI